MFRQLAPLCMLALAVLSSPTSQTTTISPRATAPESDLHGCMQGLKDNLKRTALALRGEDKKAALVHVAELERFVLLAKLHEPANLDEVSEPERAAHRTAFRSELVMLLKELADMELDLLAGRHDEALARVTGPLFKLRNQAHERYQQKQ